MAMPILTFDERALSPSFGYVFQQRWLQPYESIVGILWKFARMNRLPAHTVVMHLRRGDLDPYAGINPLEVDVSLVARLLGITRKSVSDGVGRCHEAACPLLRTCGRCLSLGYHARLHQLLRHERCPIHGQPLQTLCRRCGQACTYRLNALLIDAAFRCAHCRAYRTFTGAAPTSWRLPLPAKDRIAITRAALA
jgi:hypothetical protein